MKKTKSGLGMRKRAKREWKITKGGRNEIINDVDGLSWKTNKDDDDGSAGPISNKQQQQQQQPVAHTEKTAGIYIPTCNSTLGLNHQEGNTDESDFEFSILRIESTKPSWVSSGAKQKTIL